MKSTGGAPTPSFNRKLGSIERHLPWHKARIRVAAVIGSNDRPLEEWRNWNQIMPSLTALTRQLRQKATIRPWIYPKAGGRSAVPFGLMHFTEPNNRRWIQTLEDPELYLDQLQIWSPARSSTIERGRCPDLYAQLVGGGELEEQGFVLAVSLDQIDALAEGADAVIKDVEALLAPSRTLISDRSWEERRIAGIIRVNNLDDGGPWDAFEWAQANVTRQRPAFA